MPTPVEIPLQPTPAPAPVAVAPAVTPTPTTTPTPAPTATPTVSSIPRTTSAPSPIQRQHRAPRGNQPDYEPISLVFLSGLYSGKSIDLGLFAGEMSHSQSANWNDQGTNGIRDGVTFSNISPREIGITVEYADIQHDITHLAEAVALLQEIGDGEKTPPKLLLVQGNNKMAPLVCTSFQQTYSEPHGGRQRGFRHVKIEMRFKLYGGKASEHALAPPLASTPLKDEIARQTEVERQQQARVDVTELLLADCLGQQGSDALTNLIEQNRLNDPAAVAALPDDALVQGAIAGLFSKETLQNQTVNDRLRVALASVMAANEPGVLASPRARLFAEALITGNPARLSPQYQEQAIRTKADYDALLTAIVNQDLAEDSSIFADGSSTGERLRSGFGSCGLSLRGNGGLDIRAGGSSGDAERLRQINELLAAPETTDADIKEQFGLTGDRQIKALRNGAPYQTRQAFIDHIAQLGNKTSAWGIWQRFGNPTGGGEETPPTNTPTDTPPTS